MIDEKILQTIRDCQTDKLVSSLLIYQATKASVDALVKACQDELARRTWDPNPPGPTGVPESDPWAR